MSIEGRINVDVLFHDKDGTASLKVVSLQDSQAYASGKVAVVSGTVGTSQITIQTQPTTYRDSSGALVSFSDASIVVFQCSANAQASEVSGSAYSRALANTPVVLHSEQGGIDGFAIRANSGTGTYTIVMYGT